MKWFLIFLVIAPLGRIRGDELGFASGAQDEKHVGHRNQEQQGSAQVYYYQHHPQYPQGPYNNYNQYPTPSHQKQDSLADTFGFGQDGGGDGDLLGAGGGIGGVIAAILGIKGLTKLGAAALFIFIFVIVPILILPLVLSIAAIALAAMNGDTGSSGGIMDKMKELMGGGKQREAMSTLESFLRSEDCVERIACSLGAQAFPRSYSLRGKKESKKRDAESSHTEAEKPGILRRVARGLKAENCHQYKCSIISSFSS